MIFNKRKDNNKFKTDTINYTESTEEDIFSKNDGSNTIEPSVFDQRTDSDNNMIEDLMTLIMKAIDTWAVKYNLTNLPKDIIFEQALSAMQEIDRLNKQRINR